MSLGLRAGSPSRSFNMEGNSCHALCVIVIKAIGFVISVTDVYYELTLLPANGFIKKNKTCRIIDKLNCLVLLSALGTRLNNPHVNNP